MGNINYRAVHVKSTWRKVNNHNSLENAIHGKDGAVGLFARKVRINYETHGDPLYVIVWEDGAGQGYLIKQDDETLRQGGIHKVTIPITEIHRFEQNGGANPYELEEYFP